MMSPNEQQQSEQLIAAELYRMQQRGREDESNNSLMNLLNWQQQQQMGTMGGAAAGVAASPAFPSVPPMILPSVAASPTDTATPAAGASSSNNAFDSSQQHQMNNFMLPQSLMNNFGLGNMGGLNAMNNGMRTTNQTAVPNVPQAQLVPKKVSSTVMSPNATAGGDQLGSMSNSAFEKVDLGHSIAFRDSSPPMSSVGGNGNGSFVPQQNPFANKQLHVNPLTNNQGACSMNNMDSLGMMNSFLQNNSQLNSINFPAKNVGEGFGPMMNGMPQKATAGFMDSVQASLALTATNNSMINNPPPQQLQPVSQEDPGWDEKYMSLRNYCLQYGNCRVPARFKKDPKLGRWVMTQRRQFTLLMQGLPSALTAERIRKLEGLGFAWSVRPEPVATWNQKFHELKAYKATYGNCTVPQRYQANPQLGTWVHTQRRQHKLMIEGKKSSMSKEKVAALDSVGFDWDAKHLQQGCSGTSTTKDKCGTCESQSSKNKSRQYDNEHGGNDH